jgi:hypothetical protein
MLSNPQKALIKSAQREAELADEEYRDVLETVTGARSSTDPRLGDRAFDKILAFLEAIYWRKADRDELQRLCKARSVFQKRGYWAQKNTRAETSRDRFTRDSLSAEIAELERGLAELGYGESYCAGIRKRSDQARSEFAALHAYRIALQRTLTAKRRMVAPALSANA